MIINTIIVENEVGSEENLIKLINNNFNNINICAITRTVYQCLEAIKKYNPELIFLDVELNSPETGFDILNQVDDLKFKVIFTTGYEKYAIQAFRFSAIDYLLKPINENELVEAVNKFILTKKMTTTAQRDSLNSYYYNFPDAFLQLPDSEGFNIVNIRDIVYFEGDNNKVNVILINGNTISVNKKLGYYVDVLVEKGFCQIHKSYLVNIQHIIKYIRNDGGHIKVKGGKLLSVSRYYKDELLAILKT